MAQPGFPLITVISQYANSPTLIELIEAMHGAISPDADIDAFYDYVWNVSTAQGFGLDIWGRIVGVGRSLNIPGSITNFGFKEGTGAQPFDQAPFYNGVVASTVYTLQDDAYRVLILAKALANISDTTAPNLNRLLRALFPGRGRTYVADTGQMQMRYVFEFTLAPFELAIVTQSGALPRPAAVLSQALIVDTANTFGFAEATGSQPFGQGTFFNPTTGLVNAA